MESLVVLVLALGVVMLLPQYGHSRAKLLIVLFGEGKVEGKDEGGMNRGGRIG